MLARAAEAEEDASGSVPQQKEEQLLPAGTGKHEPGTKLSKEQKKAKYLQIIMGKNIIYLMLLK